MPSRLPNKGDVIFAHLDDGDYVGLINLTLVLEFPKTEETRFYVHWLLRPERSIDIYDRSLMLEMISNGKVKVLNDNVLGTNIDFPRYGVGDLLITNVSKGQFVGYIQRVIVKGHEVTLPDDSKHHCQFFYVVHTPKQRNPEETADGHKIEYITKDKVEEVPEVLIDWGLKMDTISVQRRANKT